MTDILPVERYRRPVEMYLYEEGLASLGYRHICGIDEAGRGALAGPVVAAAVILPLRYVIVGIRDSKLLTPRQREIFFDQIQKDALAIGIGVVDNHLIDEINILQATIAAMQEGIEKLAVKPDYLLIDALTLPRVSIPQKGIVHGDNLSATIAAASVVAKVTRDRLMRQYHEEFPRYNFHLHKGYGTGEHLRKIKEFGPCGIHRKTFRGVIV